MLLPTKFSDRVRLDRYAIKDSTVPLNPGDLVVVSLQRRGRDGSPKEFREVGQVVAVQGTNHTVKVAPQSAELLTPGITVVASGDYAELRGVQRNATEYIVEQDWETICQRVSGAVLGIDHDADCGEFFLRVCKSMVAGRYITAGRILSGLGRTDRHDLTFYNCYVFRIPGDSREAIARHWGRILDTFSSGGGVGWDLSVLRPKNDVVKKVNGRSSGVVSWAEQFSQVTGTVEQGGSRRGASLQGLWCWHPDIYDFIAAKSLRENLTVNGTQLSVSKKLLYNSNVSVFISNAFMQAVKQDTDWDLVFPDREDPDYDTVWTGDLPAWKSLGKNVVVYKTVRARDLWQNIIVKAWESGEPGLVFLERANDLSNSWYFNTLSGCNPCSEQVLPTNGVCNLAHVNLARFVKPWWKQPLPFAQMIDFIDWDALVQTVRDGVRFLDDVINMNHDRDPEVAAQQHGERRIGLGILGYGEMLMRLGLAYGSDEAVRFTDLLFERIWATAYDASADLAKTRGAFPKFNADKFLASGFIQQPHIQASGYWPNIKAKIQQHGIRNVTCLTVAPTGSVSVLLETTSGIEPYFDLEYTSTTRIGTTDEQAGIVGDLAKQFGPDRTAWPNYVVTAQQGITPEQHVITQATAQKWVDSALSKCIAAGTLIPTDKGLIAIEAFADTHEVDTFAPTKGEFKTSGHKILSHYRAGEKPATRIRLDNGAELIGATESHQVLTPEGWRLMSELKSGDLVIGRLQESHGEGGLPLTWTDTMRTNANTTKTPTHMTPAFAEFLGMLAADGHTTETTGHVGLTCKNNHVAAVFRGLCQGIFGVAPAEITDKRNGVLSLYLTSRNLVRFIESLMGKGAYNKYVPIAVVQGSREEKIAFLTGVTLDGYITASGLVVYEGMSRNLAYHIAEIARSFGLPRVNQGNKWVKSTQAYTHSVTISNEMQEVIIPIERHKRKPITYKRFKVMADVHKIARSTFSSRSTEYYALRTAQNRSQDCLFNTTAKALGVSADIPVHRITKVENAGMVEMYDIEVEGAHEYVVNGMVSHNTVNLPETATVDDIARAYMMMWDQGCKGGTVYRDKSRDEQVLYTKDTTIQVAQEENPPADIPMIDKCTGRIEMVDHDAVMPRLSFGMTPLFSEDSPVGTIHVGVRHDPVTGEPADMFIANGYGDVGADAQAIGRLCSLILRLKGAKVSQVGKLALIQEQLQGIPGRTQSGFAHNLRLSMPDTIAHILGLYAEGKFPLANLPLGSEHIDSIFGDFAKIDPEARRSMIAYLKNQHGAYTEDPEVHDVPALTAQRPHDPVAASKGKMDFCPECGGATLLIVPGKCSACRACGYSRC